MILRNSSDVCLSQHRLCTILTFGVKNNSTLVLSLTFTGGASKRVRNAEEGKFKTKEERISQVQNDNKLYLLQMNSLAMPDLQSSKEAIININNTLNEKSLTEALDALSIENLKVLKLNLDNCGNDEKTKVGHIVKAITTRVTKPVEDAEFFIKCLKDNTISLTFTALLYAFAQHHGRVSWENFKGYLDTKIEEKAEARGKASMTQQMSD